MVWVISKDSELHVIVQFVYLVFLSEISRLSACFGFLLLGFRCLGLRIPSQACQIGFSFESIYVLFVCRYAIYRVLILGLFKQDPENVSRLPERAITLEIVEPPR